MKITVYLLALFLSAALASCVPQTIPPPSGPVAQTAPPATSAPATLAPVNLPTVTLAASGPATPAQMNTPSATVSPIFSRAYLIVMENHEYADIVGRPSAPYLNRLIEQYGLATNYRGITHPSEPNYFALFSGSTQGVTDDGVYNLVSVNLADQLEVKGKTWRVFAENVPTDCFAGEVGMNGEDGIGAYARKHNPAISFVDIRNVPARCANITDLTHFNPAAADYSLIIPNLCHDMHDCSVASSDSFLAGWVPKILNSPAWQTGGVLFITWDEGTTNQSGGGHVPLLVISNMVPRGFKSSTASNHYSLLRTVEDAWGLGCLNEACKANDLGEFFH